VAGRSKNSPRAGGGTRGRLLALLAATLTFIVPPRVGYWLCDRLAEVAFLVAGRYREAALANLAQVLGLPTGHPRVRAAARRAFRTSARNFWDLCSLPHRDPHLLAQWTVVTPGAWEVMLGALRRRRGLVIVTAHLGAFDYAGQLIALLPVRARILTARTTSGWLFETVTWLSAGAA
jgi:lauroyl/myristoyl acyltransferase